jgi:hypothetical protein
MNTTDNPSDVTLERTPQRALAFVVGVSRTARVRRAMEAVGLNKEERTIALMLLARLLGEDTGADQASSLAYDEQVRAARLVLDSQGRSFVRRFIALVKRLAPGLADDLLRGVDLDGAIVLTLPLVLQRTSALANDPRPEAAALSAALELRRLGADTQARLAASVATVTGMDAAPAPQSPLAGQERRAALLDLYWWLKDWSEAARNVLPNRRDQIRLGLASPRARSAGQASTEPAAPAAPPASAPAEPDPQP